MLTEDKNSNRFFFNPFFYTFIYRIQKPQDFQSNMVIIGKSESFVMIIFRNIIIRLHCVNIKKIDNPKRVGPFKGRK